MSLQREAPRGRRLRDDDLDLDAEQEVDVRRYWERISVHWWLPLAGLAIGLVAGLLLATGGKQVYKAEATLYLGQPFNPPGTASVPTVGTNPTIVNQTIHDEAILRDASARSGMRIGQLRSGVTSKVVSGSAGRRAAPGTTPLVKISVRGSSRLRVQRAANFLAYRTAFEVSPYVISKIATLKAQLTAQTRELASLDRRVAALNEAVTASTNLPALDRLVLISQVDNAEQRRTAVESEQLATRQLLNLANKVERAQVIEPAIAVKTTARSKRNSMLVGGLLGLLLGGIAALLWEPMVERRIRK
jgi:uncharacterized protein involved in exopolysaccharide biosynthesis